MFYYASPIDSQVIFNSYIGYSYVKLPEGHLSH